MHTTLVILAAGLGSRFGGNKQLSCVGPHGECLMEYSIHDAIEAGFSRIVFILKEEMVDIVRDRVGKRLEGKARVDYAVQDESTIPDFYRIPKERVKPFGTVHALLCASAFLDQPFATVNADDYYGKDAFRIMHRLLCGLKNGAEAAMVPYVLGNTMSENGGVSRGICTVRDGFLVSVKETKDICYNERHEIASNGVVLPPNAEVSMNIWGFHPAAVPEIQAYFYRFLSALSEDELKAECLLPVMVNDFLADGRLTVRAEASGDQWFGLTYRADLDDVAKALIRLHENGAYPNRLFD